MKQSKQLLLSVFALIISLAFAATLYADTQKDQKTSDTKNSGPKIKFEELSHDFGTTTQNSVLKHTFKFKNEGTEKLIIEKVKAG